MGVDPLLSPLFQHLERPDSGAKIVDQNGPPQHPRAPPAPELDSRFQGTRRGHSMKNQISLGRHTSLLRQFHISKGRDRLRASDGALLRIHLVDQMLPR